MEDKREKSNYCIMGDICISNCNFCYFCIYCKHADYMGGIFNCDADCVSLFLGSDYFNGDRCGPFQKGEVVD